ncbi:reverse transcriptase [Tanacetum coccineum]
MTVTLIAGKPQRQFPPPTAAYTGGTQPTFPIEKTENNVLWQSFDYPGDTFIPDTIAAFWNITDGETIVSGKCYVRWKHDPTGICAGPAATAIDHELIATVVGKVIAKVLEKNSLPASIITSFCGGADIGQSIATDIRIPLVAFTRNSKFLSVTQNKLKSLSMAVSHDYRLLHDNCEAVETIMWDVSKYGHENLDLKRVLEDGLWSFERNLVVLKSIDNDEQPSEHEMKKVPLWIRLFNVPLSRRNKSHVGGIAAKLGEVLGVDNFYFVNRGKHNRARVMINITMPLCRYVTVLNLHNTKVQVHVQYERMPNFCYWCGLLGHTVKECLTKPNEIDWKTFTEWPFQESLRASNSKDDGLFSGVAFPTHSSMTMSVGLEPLSNFKDLSHDNPNGGIFRNTMKTKYDVQSQSKLISGGCVLDVDRIDRSHGSSNGLQVEIKHTGHVGVNKIVGPDLRKGEIRLEVISHTGPVDNKQSGAIKATQPKVWKRHDRKGHEKNIMNETKDETSRGKRPLEDYVGEDNMDVDSVKKLKDNCDFNLMASVALQHRRQQ